MSLRVLFAGGGTGGHLYPAIAIADALRARATIDFIGTADRLETRIVPDAGYTLTTIASRPLVRRLSLETLRTIAANALGVIQALRALHTLRPDIVIATGGYVCFPVMLAARLLRVARASTASLALLEPNARPGLTNRLLAPLVDEVWGAFPDTHGAFAQKYVRTGIPVRAELRATIDRAEAAVRLGLDPYRRTILVMGGSQGARSLNAAVATLVTTRALPPDWQILHVSGEREYETTANAERAPFGENQVRLVPYLRNVADAYAMSDLVVARAGASTLGELAALGLPSVLVPYPFASEKHQAVNAAAFERAGAAIVIADRELDAETLWHALTNVMEPAHLMQMRTGTRSLANGDPTAAIAARIDALLSRRKHG